MTSCFAARATSATRPIVPLEADGLSRWLKRQSSAVRAWVAAQGFTGNPGEVCLVPAPAGGLGQVLVGAAAADALWSLADLPGRLPKGSYRLDARWGAAPATSAALGWALGCYRFDRYKTVKRPAARLVWPKGADRAAVDRAAEATGLARDLINTPADDMGPPELAAAARHLARRHKARFSVITGDDLLKRGYPSVHAVGRAAAKPPRLIDVTWGDKAAPKVTLVGKGVCFDTGGLDLKGAGNMKLMKKDMGGGAQVLGLAHMVMAAGLPVRLRVLVPAVENNVAGNAMRPLDVLQTRKGLTVEVGNTDAEGRLILSDALAEADREKPELIVDCATLTGAARVALGTEVPAVFCNHDGVADALLKHGVQQDDPLWRLPLWRPYRKSLDSRVADICNISDGGYGGAITAALFLQAFVSDETPWIHIDMMGWNLRHRPGRPIGGEAMGMRALFALIADRFGGTKTRAKR